jgi:hypothetical protein
MIEQHSEGRRRCWRVRRMCDRLAAAPAPGYANNSYIIATLPLPLKIYNIPTARRLV